jgi:hypothetical protein
MWETRDHTLNGSPSDWEPRPGGRGPLGFTPSFEAVGRHGIFGALLLTRGRLGAARPPSVLALLGH